MKTLCVVVFVALCNTLGFAQSGTSHFEVFGGYTRSSFNQNVVSTDVQFNGWDASVAYKPAPHFAAVADFGGNYGTSDLYNIRAHTFLFGPQVSIPVGSRVSLFVHGLFGEMHLTRSFPQSGGPATVSRNAFSAALGGGVDIRLAGHVAWRSLADDLHGDFHNADPQNPFPNANWRVSTGILLRF